MRRQTSLLTISLAALFCLDSIAAQVSTDWHKRLGTPQAERFVLRGGFSMTVTYSEQGQSCKAVVQSTTVDSKGRPEPRTKTEVERILNYLLPPADRGNPVRSIGLSSSMSGVGSVQYETLSISMDRGTSDRAEDVTSATIIWNGVKCRAPEEASLGVQP